MSKKLICFGIAIITIFSLAACNQGNEFDEYKTAAKSTLEIYAENKEQGNYTSEDRADINRFVSEGKAAIDAAADKASVDSAVAAAKQAIDGILEVEVVEEKEINFSIGLNSEFFFCDNQACIINTYDDWTNLPNNIKINSLKYGVGEIFAEQYIEQLFNSLGLNERYAEEFFVDNALIIYFCRQVKDFDAEITRVSKSKNELLVEIEVDLGRLTSGQRKYYYN